MSDQPIVEQILPSHPQEGFIPVAPIETQETQKLVEATPTTSKATLIKPQTPIEVDSLSTPNLSSSPTNEWGGYGYIPTEGISGAGTSGDDMSRRVRAKANGEPPTE